MKQFIRDAVLLGTALWLLGYLASLLLFVTPLHPVMGWVLIGFFTPVTTAIAWYWFRARDQPLPYYVKVGLAWTVLAIVLDYLFIVLLFSATYYGPDVFVYYAVTFAIPVGVGWRLQGRKKAEAGQG